LPRRRDHRLPGVVQIDLARLSNRATVREFQFETITSVQIRSMANRLASLIANKREPTL